jgi:hypothetical protein
MVTDITKAFRAKAGLSLNDNIYIFTGDVAPTDPSMLTVPYGSMYIRTGDTGGIFEYTTAGWIDLAASGVSNGIPGYHVYGMRSNSVATPLVFTISGLVSGSYYFISIRRPMTLEIRGIAGRLRVYDAAGSYYTLFGAARAANNGTSSWPVLYNLTPGVYALAPSASGTQTLSIHGIAGPAPASLNRSFSATAVVDNGIFKWNGPNYIAEESY